jgi:hypothetical protein
MHSVRTVQSYRLLKQVVEIRDLRPASTNDTYVNRRALKVKLLAVREQYNHIGLMNVQYTYVCSALTVP